MKHFIVTLILILVTSVTTADTYLDIHGVSKHLNTTTKYNENNTGIGITHDLNENTYISIGGYRNSMDKHSNYILYGYRLLNTKYFDINLQDGLVTGYTNIPIPAFLPIISIGDKYKLNIGTIPAINGITPAVIFFNTSIKL